jgi:hypothetical protein
MTVSTKHLRLAVAVSGVLLATTLALSFATLGRAETPIPVVTDRSALGELAFWNAIKEAKEPEAFKAYLDNFPNGMFADPAIARYAQLSGKSVDGGQLPLADVPAGASTAATEQTETPPKPAVKPKPAQKKATNAAVKKKQAPTQNKKKTKKVTKKQAAAKRAPAASAKAGVPPAGASGTAKCDPAVDKNCPAPKKTALQKLKKGDGGGGGGSSGGGGGWGN